MTIKPCPCECNSGGFCGGCGHAGCSGGINLANRIVTPSEANKTGDMMPPHGHPDHKCSSDFVYEMRFTGSELKVIHMLLSQASAAIGVQGMIDILSGDAAPAEVDKALARLADIDDKIVDAVKPRIEEQLRAEARWAEFHV